MNKKKQNDLIRYALKNIKPFNDKDTIVYAHLIKEPLDKEEMRDSNLLLHFEIFTERSIQSDNIFFTNHQIANEDYIPYIYTFSITNEHDNSTEELSKFEQEILENNGWIKGKISKNSNIGFQGHLSLAFGLVHKEHNNQKLPLELDASFIPIRMSIGDKYYSKLQETKEINARILHNIEYNPTEMSNLDSQQSSDNPSTPYNVKIYKVGAANTITIEKDDHCILFDCGKRNPPVPSVINKIIDNVKPTIIIISHLHTDHYNLITNINCDKVTHIIVPDLNIIIAKNSSITNFLVALKKRNIQIIDLSKINDYKDLLKTFGYSNIDIFLGTNRGDPGENSPLGHIKYDRSIDDSGIILSIKSHNSDKRAIFPGDCSYYSWPNEEELNLLNTIKLIVPHHGGHIISKDMQDTYTGINSTVFLSSNFRALINRNDINGNTNHFTFVQTVLNNPFIKITANNPNSYFSFKI